MDVKKDLIAIIEEHLEVAKNAQIEGFDTLKEYLDNSELMVKGIIKVIECHETRV